MYGFTGFVVNLAPRRPNTDRAGKHPTISSSLNLVSELAVLINDALTGTHTVM